MKKTSIGGQALIEGIMMKGPEKTVLSVRYTDGTILSEPVSENNWSKKYRILRWPIIRGVVNFINSLITGYKTLMRSADLSGMTELEEQQQAEKAAKKKNKTGTVLEENAATAKGEASAEDLENATPSAEKTEPNKLSGVAMTLTMVLGCILGVGLALFLFMWLPARIFDLVQALSGGRLSAWLKPLIEGILKIILFVVYLVLVSMTKDIKRVFQYHGAEHKTIFCYESGAELTVENARRQSRFHPRCGTSFMVLMLVVGIALGYVVLAIFPGITKYRLLWVLAKILIVPLVCGLGYELIKLCGRHDNIFTRFIAAPGLWVQRITTKEPDDSMLEVAICALKQVLPQEDESDSL